jgi:hypothetical protein
MMQSSASTALKEVTVDKSWAQMGQDLALAKYSESTRSRYLGFAVELANREFILQDAKIAGEHVGIVREHARMVPRHEKNVPHYATTDGDRLGPIDKRS